MENQPDSNQNKEQNISSTQEIPKVSEINPKDEFVIGNGFVIDDSLNTLKPEKTKKPKNKKKIVLSIFWIVLILIISVSLAVGGIYCIIDYMGLGGSKTITVTYEKGESLDSITDELYQKGAVKIPQLFKIYAGKKGYYEQFTEGVHTFNTDIGYSGIILELTTVEGYTVESATVTIPQMASVDGIAKLLEEKGICSCEDFIDEVQNGEFKYSFIKDIPVKTVHYRLEGYLFPDTYDFYKWNSKDGAHNAIDKMLNNFNTKFEEKYKEKASKMGYTLHQAVTMASIVEMECCGYDKECKNVSAVFYNRLNHWGDQPKFLGSSPTANYPYGSGNYDTNKIEGLPPGPVCSPGAAAIKGTLYPNKKYNKEYFYFVTDSDYNFYYSRTFDEHNNTIYSLRANGKWKEEE